MCGSEMAEIIWMPKPTTQFAISQEDMNDHSAKGVYREKEFPMSVLFSSFLEKENYLHVCS